MEKIFLDSREEGLNTLDMTNEDDENKHPKDDEEQEVVLEIGHTDLGMYYEDEESNAGTERYNQRSPDGTETLPVRYAMDQHQRYLEAVIGEHKVKVENRGEALVVDADSGDDDDNGGDGGGSSGGRNNFSDSDVNNEDEYDEKNKYNEEDINVDKDDKQNTNGASRRDSGIEEKSEHSGISEGKVANHSLFDPLTFESGKNGFHGSTTNISANGKNGLHPRLSHSSSSDTGNLADKAGKKHRAFNGTLNSKTANGRAPSHLASRLPSEPTEVDRKSINSIIESSGGVRVFPPEATLNGNFKEWSGRDMASLGQTSGGEGKGKITGRQPPDPLPRGVSPPVKYVRSMKAPDISNATHAGELDLESFAELTDL